MKLIKLLKKIVFLVIHFSIKFETIIKIYDFQELNLFITQ